MVDPLSLHDAPPIFAGTIKEVKVKAGDKVKPGQSVLVLDNGAAPKQEAKPESKQEAPKQEASKQEAPKQEAAKQEAPKHEAPKHEAPKQQAPKQQAAPAPEEEEAAAPPERPRASVTNISVARPAPVAAPAPAPPSQATASPAAPSVRRLAREIGVDVTQVPGTGPGGRITQDDVKEFAKRVMHSLGGNGQSAAAGSAAVARSVTSQPLPEIGRAHV